METMEKVFDRHEEATDALLAGQPGKARELLESVAEDLPLQSQVLDAAAMILGANQKRGETWRALLDRMNGEGARTHLSTIAADGNMDMAPFVEAATAVGKAPEETARGLRMVAYDGAETKWSLHLPEQKEGCLLVHVLVHCPSFCADRFYVHVRAGGGGGGESVRITAQRVTFCDANLAVRAATRIPRLFSFLLEKDRCTACLDGEAMAINTGGGRAEPVLEIKLTEDLERRADVEATVLAVEVASSKSPRIPDPMAVEFQKARVDRVLNEGDSEELIEALAILQANDASEASKLTRTVLARLQARGRAPDWLLTELLEMLPAEEAEEFRQAHCQLWGTKLVEVEGVRVRFYRSAQKLFTWARLRRKYLGRGEDDSFLVLDDVSMDLYEGDILGIIGRNGAGKSTLLRTITGMIPLEKGRVVVNGQFLLLSAGMGVRIELSGRENIFLGGYFMGLTHAEISAKFDSIVEFAELEHAIDQPFKFYSDGMKARLVFSMATSVSPHILMLDELLSAGDLSFQAKAQDRMTELIDKAGAVVVVTHGVDFVRDKCTKALYIKDGRVAAYGSPLRAVDLYLKDLHLEDTDASTDPAVLAGMMAQASTMPAMPAAP